MWVIGWEGDESSGVFSTCGKLGLGAVEVSREGGFFVDGIGGYSGTGAVDVKSEKESWWRWKGLYVFEFKLVDDDDDAWAKNGSLGWRKETEEVLAPIYREI